MIPQPGLPITLAERDESGGDPHPAGPPEPAWAPETGKEYGWPDLLLAPHPQPPLETGEGRGAPSSASANDLVTPACPIYSLSP